MLTEKWLPFYFPLFHRKFEKINGFTILKQKGFSEEKKNLFEILSNDILLLNALNLLINNDVILEVIIRTLRADILNNFHEYKFCNNFHKLTGAIAKQLFKNEYIYDESEEEKKQIEKLSEYIRNLNEGSKIDWEKIEIFSLYRNLNEFENLLGSNFPRHMKTTCCR